MIKSVNFVILGKQDLASEFGKKGTETDLTLYDRKESDIIKTWVIPNGFPEKIQPLLQAINIAESTNLKRPKNDIKNIVMCSQCACLQNLARKLPFHVVFCQCS